MNTPSRGGRRLTRRGALRVVGATAVLSGLAGCSSEDGTPENGGDAGGPGGDDTTGTSDSSGAGGDTTSRTDAGETQSKGQSGGQTESGDGSGQGEFVRESMGSIGRDAVPELTIVAWESEVTDIEFNVQVAVRNDGDQQADAREYTFQITPYDESGTELETKGTSVAYPFETQMSPGGVGSVVVTPDMDADPETVASYEVNLHCDGPFAEGVYCSS